MRRVCVSARLGDRGDRHLCVRAYGLQPDPHWQCAAVCRFLLLARFLRSEGYETKLVINVTDINDKIYDAARAAGEPSGEFAARMTRAYFEDTERLGLGRPDAEPLATETIGEILELIAELIDTGHAYESGGDVYFKVRSFAPTGSSPTGARRTWTRERRPARSRSSRTRLTSRSGRRIRRARTRNGTRPGGRAGLVGTSSARPWPRLSWGHPSRSTAAVPIWFSPITRTRSPSPRPRVVRLPGSGCTTG